MSIVKKHKKRYQNRGKILFRTFFTKIRVNFRHFGYLQNRFFVSRYQLTEVFRRSTGMTLTGYIIYKRLMFVKSLVRSGEGIENAAYKAGFNTYSHFYKEFKKRYATSPKKYFRNP